MAYQDLDSIHVPAAGQRPPASWGLQVNANFDQIYSDVLAKLGAWNGFTPTLVQSGAVAKNVNNARYQKLGRIAVGHVHLGVTAAGTGGNAITVGLPVAAASFSGTPIIGTFWCYDASTPIGYHGALVLVSTTAAVGWASGQSGNIGVTPNFALANSDQVGYSFTYETAS